MATLRILVPDDTINYIKNPAMRYDITGWSSVSSAISRSLNFARFGMASLRIVTSGLALREGAYYRVNALQGVSEPITASVYLRGTGVVRLRLIDNPTGKEWVTQPIALRSTRWIRQSVSGFSTGSNDMRLYVETSGKTIQATTFYADGAQMERKPYATTYVDGDQPGCRWSGLSHGSASSRPISERMGGRWVSLASPEYESKDLYMTVINGLGVAPISNITNPFALLPGSYHQGIKINDRVIIISFHTKHKDFRICAPKTIEALHELRQALFDIIKPDKALNSEFVIEYKDGPNPVYVKARYEAGMEGEWDVRNRWVNSFPVRMLSVSPLMWEDDQEVATLDFQDNFIANNVAARIDGRWSALNFGFNGNVNDFEIGSRKEIIGVGTFTTANNNAQAVDPLVGANRIAYWDGEKWVPYGAGANGTINDAAVAPNGYVYVVGNFTSIGGVAANRVAYWNGVSWNAMGTGLNAEGYNIVVAPNGYVYVGGTFTTAGGTTALYIARWNGNAWYAAGNNNGLNGFVHSIAISPDGTLLYAGGAFTDENGNPGSGLTRVASYNIQTGLWDNMGNGFSSTVREITISPTGQIYAAGEFTLSGTETINYIGQWNGAAWVPLGAGMNGTVNSMDVAPNGDLVAVGAFTQAGGVNVKKIALWNGSTWVNLDLDIGVGNTGTEIYSVTFLPNGDLFIGGTQFSASVYPTLYSGLNTVENVGSTSVSPRLYLLGPGTLRWLENQTNQKRVFLNLAVLSGEEVFIDFATASIQSSVRGNLSFAILQGSDFRSFTLLPGPNKISAFMEDDISATLQMSYTPNHWGADATAVPEVL